MSRRQQCHPLSPASCVSRQRWLRLGGMDGRRSQPQLRKGPYGGSGLVLASPDFPDNEPDTDLYGSKTDTREERDGEVEVWLRARGGLLETDLDRIEGGEEEEEAGKRWPKAWLFVCCFGKEAMVDQIREMLPMSYRNVMVGMVWLTFLLMACQRFLLAPTSFPIFDLQYRWNRFHQAVFLCAPWLGGMLVPTVAALASANTRHLHRLLVAFLLAATCLNVMFTNSSDSFYDMWANRLFAGVLEGAVLAVLLQILWQWVPRVDLPAHMTLLWAAVGAAIIAADYVSSGANAVQGVWKYLYCCLAALCMLASVVWMSPPFITWPASNSMVQYDELAIITSSRGWAETKLTRANLLDMANRAISSIAVWRLAAGAACYGWLLVPVWSTNSIYYLEQHSLAMSMRVLPYQAKYPWMLWILVLCLLASFLAFVRHKWSKRRLTICLATLEALGVLMTAYALHYIGDYHSLGTTSPKYCRMVIGAAVGSGALVASTPLANVPVSLPVLGGIMAASFSATGYLSLMLLGNILDMAGAWSISFDYHVKLLLFYVSVCYVLPLLLLARDLPWLRGGKATPTALSI